VGSADEVAEAPEAAPAQVETVYVTLPPPPEAPAPPPAAVALDPQEPHDGWVPGALPAPNPFAHSLTWIGDYDCTQGTTGLALRVMDVRGRAIRAIFDFHHVPSGAAGQYLVLGTHDPATGKVSFTPGAWLRQPDGYVNVGMEGEVSPGGSLFTGRIPFPGCGRFRLRRAR
jgi:hypothetical protein